MQDVRRQGHQGAIVMGDPNMQDCINDSHEKRIKSLERDVSQLVAWVKLTEKKREVKVA